MIKTGRHLFSAALMLISLNLAAAEISTGVQNRVIGLNESTILEIKVSDVKAVEPLQPLPDISGLGFGYAGITRAKQWVNGVSWSGFILQYRITGLKEGKYTVPPVKFMADGQQYASDSFELSVSSKVRTRPKSLLDQFFGENGESLFSDGEPEVEFRVETEKNEIYAGEPVVARLYLVTNMPQGLKVRSAGNDTDESKFYVKPVDEEIEDSTFEDHGIIFYKKHLQTYVYIPLTTGSFSICGGQAVYLQQESFSVVQKTRSFEGRQINVRALPAGVTGDVYTGSFTLDFERNAIRKTDHEAVFTMKLSGSGNFAMPINWTVEKDGDFDVLSTVSDADFKISAGEITGNYTYTVNVVPGTSNDCRINNIYINTFDPASRTYRKIETGPLDFVFKPESRTESGEDESYTGGNAGKILQVIAVSSVMILLSVSAFLGFLVYEKKKSAGEAAAESVKTSDLKKRITARLNGERANSSTGNYIAELRQALRSTDRVRTITVIEKSIGFLRDNGHGSKQLDQIHEMISLSKFGGAGLSNETLSRIINDVVDMIKDVK